MDLESMSLILNEPNEAVKETTDDKKSSLIVISCFICLDSIEEVRYLVYFFD